MTTITSSLIVRLIDQVTGPAGQVEESLRRINRAGAAGPGGAPSFADDMAAAQERVAGAIARNNAALDASRGRLFDAVAGYYALSSAIGAPIRAAGAFEEAMADVRKVVDFPSPEAFRDFQNDLFQLSRRVPLTVEELSQIAAAAGEAGFGVDDLLTVTEDAARIAVAFGTSAREAGDMLAAMQQSYGMSRTEAVLLSDAMNHLSNRMASSAPELMSFWTRIAADAGRAGFSQQQAVALGSAMIASGHGAEVAATSFRAMVRALTRGESATARQQTAYERLGLTAEDVAFRMQEDAVGTTRDVLARIAALPAEMQNAISSDIFGDEARALGSIGTNLEFFDRAIGAVADEADYAGSALAEFEVRAGTFNNAVTLLRNRITELSIRIGEALLPALNRLMEVAAPMIERLADLAAAYPEVTAAVVGTTAALIALKVAAAGLTFVGLLGRGGTLALLAGGLRAITLLGTPVAGFFETLAVRNALAARSLGRTPGALARIGDAGRVLLRGLPGFTAISGALSGIGAALAGITAPVWMGIAGGALAVAAAGAAIWRYWDRLSAIFSGIATRVMEELQPALDALRPVLDFLSPAFNLVAAAASGIASGFDRAVEAGRAFAGWIGSFFEREVLTDEQRASWEAGGYGAADAFINAIKAGFRNFVYWISGQWALDLFEAATGIDLTAAGVAMVESIKQAFWDFLDWLRELPQRIIDAIGEIDLSGIIRMPAILGGPGRVDPVPLPAFDQAELATLDPSMRAAAETLASARGEALPTPERLADLQAYAEHLRAELSDIRARLAEIGEGPAAAFAAAPIQMELARTARELAEVEAALAEGRSRADALGAALAVLSDTEVTPEVNAASIDAALARVERLLDGLRAADARAASIASGGDPAPASRAPVGHRALGGPVWPGSSFLVGERQPEIFTPSTGGEITPLSAVERGIARLMPVIRDAVSRAVPDGGARPAAPERAESARPVTVSVSFGDINVHGASDPREVVRTIRDRLTEEIDAALRGINADMGVRS